MSAQPTAKGTLAEKPLDHLLVFMLDRQLSGTLVIEAPGEKRSAILLEQGFPSKAKTAEPVIHLGRLLLERGAIDDATLNGTLGMMTQRKQLHGQCLLSTGAVDEDTLKSALEEQVARKIHWMFNLPAKSLYGYYADQNLLAGWGGPSGTPVEPLALIWRGVRNHADPLRVATTVKKLGDRVLRFHHAAQPGRFLLGPKEKAVVDIMRAKPQSRGGLDSAGLTESDVLDKLVYTLAITRHLDLGADAAPPIGVAVARTPAIAVPEAAPPAPPPEHSQVAPPASTVPSSASVGPPSSVAPASISPGSLSGDPLEKVKREAREFAAAIEKKTFYEMLDVSQTASTTDIQGAFFSLAKQWHPDRLPPEFNDIRSVATKVFARLSEAHATLDDAAKRADYDDLIKAGGGTPEEQEQVQKVLSAVTEFQKAEVLLKMKKFDEALVHSRNAFESDPEQPEYRALYAWIRAHTSERSQSKKFGDLVKDLDIAVEAAKANVRLRVWRAQVLKLAGEHHRALKDFKYIVAREPNNLDAAREIRLATMRGDVDSTPPGKGGLFGKLFKR